MAWASIPRVKFLWRREANRDSLQEECELRDTPWETEGSGPS
jgi:hypothetical protein